MAEFLTVLVNNPQIWAIVLIFYVVSQTPTIIFKILDRSDKKTQKKEAETLLAKVSDTLTSFIVTIEKMNNKIDNLNENVSNVHTSSMQAVSNFEVANELTSRGFNHLSDSIDSINNNLNRSVDRIENMLRDLRK